MTTLESIPEDIKHLICAQVEDRASLRALWRLSKSWREVAEPLVYRAFAWTVPPTEGPKETARLLKEDSLFGKYLKHARCLELVYGELDCVALATRTEPFTLFEPLHPSDSEYRLNHHIEEDREITKQFWIPLLEIIPQFQCLRDLIFHIPGRFPPGLITAVEQYHSGCRIHLRQFRFKSLQDSVTDPDERALVISSNLHSMSILVSDDNDRFAAFSALALAPKLKHMRFLGPAIHVLERGYDSFPARTGFKPPLPEPSSGMFSSKVRTLSFCGSPGMIEHSALADLISTTNFQQLTILRFPSGDPAFLERLALNKPFPNLAELELAIRPNRDHAWSDLEALDYLHAVEAPASDFLSSLNPLRSLSLYGFLWASLLKPIVEQHAWSLTALTIETDEHTLGCLERTLLATATNLEVLATHCLKLARLNVEVRRSMGDKAEVSCYEALSKMSGLKELHIRLDCYNRDLWNLEPDEHWNDFDRTLATGKREHPTKYYGNLKCAIINLAIDEHLARDIWDLVNHEKRENGLKVLELEPINQRHYAGRYSLRPMDSVMDYVFRHWRLVADPSTGKEGVDVRDLTTPHPERGDHSLVEYSRRNKLRLEVGAPFVVFNHIWPYKPGEDCGKTWRSWPLQRDLSSDGEPH